MNTFPTQTRHSRRRFLKRLACTGLAMFGASSVLAACAPTKGQPAAGPQTRDPTTVRGWRPPAPHEGHIPGGTGMVEFPDRGSFSFDAGDVKTVRPDVFQEGHFSLFDVLVHLDDKADARPIVSPEYAFWFWICL